MKKGFLILIIVVGIMIVIFLGVLYFFNKGPDLKKYEYLKNPIIVQIPSQNMLVVVTKGDPNEIAGKAFKLLYREYYSLVGFSKNMKPVVPRARWMTDFDSPKDQWMGQFALQIPDSVTTLRSVPNDENLKLYITTWNYGTCAEILHQGSYDSERSTINKLEDYITSQGFRITGAHEEEYLKGPGLFGPGNPKNYSTIIRYPIEKIKLIKDEKGNGSR